jgi:RpiB/LacA/LacB family sugar-phosphate isomerase
LIRRLGSHSGRRIVFGYDRYLAPELDDYRGLLLCHGQMIEAVDAERLHYLSSAELVCRDVQDAPDSFGILICGTGMGMSIAANKFRGIYAARCTTVDDAEASRTINNANVVCLAAKMGFAHNAQVIEAFIRTPYTGRKLEELEYITEIEQTTAEVGARSSIVRRTA